MRKSFQRVFFFVTKEITFDRRKGQCRNYRLNWSKVQKRNEKKIFHISWKHNNINFWSNSSEQYRLKMFRNNFLFVFVVSTNIIKNSERNRTRQSANRITNKKKNINLTKNVKTKTDSSGMQTHCVYLKSHVINSSLFMLWFYLNLPNQLGTNTATGKKTGAQ